MWRKNVDDSRFDDVCETPEGCFEEIVNE